MSKHVGEKCGKLLTDGRRPGRIHGQMDGRTENCVFPVFHVQKGA